MPEQGQVPQTKLDRFEKKVREAERAKVLSEIRERLEGAKSIEAGAAALHDWREQREPSGPVEESPDPDYERREPEWWEQMVAAGRFPGDQKERREEAIAVLASAIATLDHDRELRQRAKDRGVKRPPRERVMFKSNGHLGTVLERSHGLVWVYWDATSPAAGRRMDSWVQPDDIKPAPHVDEAESSAAEYPPAPRLVESLRWAVGFIDDREKRRLPQFKSDGVPCGEDWSEWACAHDWLKDADAWVDAEVDRMEAASTGEQPTIGRTPEASEQLEPFPIPWRVGRKLGRTLYAQLGPEPSDDDPFLGLMETPMLAAQVVTIVNRSKAADRGSVSTTEQKEER